MSTAEGGSNIINDGLILYLDAANFKSYYNGSNTWYDLSKYQNDGVLTNGPTFNNNNFGSLVFDGTNDYVEVNNSSILNPTQTITLCTWAKFNGIYTGYNAPIIFKKNNSSSYFEQYVLAFNIYGNVALALGDGSNNQFIDTPLIYTNQLINIVGIIDTITSALKIYINGVLIVSGTTTYPTMSTSTSPVVIGSYNQPFTGYMGGNIYNVSIYNRVLSNEEILQNYNVCKGRFNL